MKNGKVFVHCFAGISRSATCVIAFLIDQRYMNFEEALLFVKRKR
jgi:protein-tyrosine phosphatase